MSTTIELISLNDITVGNRKRAYREDQIAELAASIEQIGLINPISGAPNSDGDGYLLVTGLHRLNACRALGWDLIPASVLALDDLDRELAEIDENLVRRELTKLEEAEHLSRRDEIVRAKGRRAPAHRPKKNEKGVNLTPLTTTADLAKQVGMSESGIQRGMRIARDIPDDVRDIIRATELANNQDQLLELAKLKDDPDQQRKVAEVIANECAENGQAPSVAMAQSILSAPQGPKLGEQDKAELHARFQEQRGPTILLGLLHEIDVASRRETEYLIRDADHKQRDRALEGIDRSIRWLESVREALETGHRSLKAVQ